ncbi:hypothetical protein D9619_003317 [Psilocybe cf. subviscida]|uniref:Copper transport protein n=1 Tax=Psilocybe cf. subviscida TaxID=2480587 RepID=A0A8H5AYI3_9AGAR|nr:hypothetical protein D9619_003317 [Psilocybe cf. subviscida]
MSLLRTIIWVCDYSLARGLRPCFSQELQSPPRVIRLIRALYAEFIAAGHWLLRSQFPFLLIQPTTNMDHSGTDTSMAMMCSMNMLWNTQIVNTCIVFRGWRIGSTAAFVWSCFAIASLSVLYEYLRFLQRKFDHRIATSLRKRREHAPVASQDQGMVSAVSVEEALPAPTANKWLRVYNPSELIVPPVPRFMRAFLYGISVFLSAFLMLVFMTYNAYLILAVVIGASIGHAAFGSTINIDAVLGGGDNGMACH